VVLLLWSVNVGVMGIKLLASANAVS
jgi:hypothetical protein